MHNIGTEKCLIAGTLSYYENDVFFQGYGQVKETFRAPTKDDFLNS